MLKITPRRLEGTVYLEVTNITSTEMQTLFLHW